jgi:hypothetical protein
VTFEFHEHPDIWLKFQAADTVAVAKERLARIYRITADRVALCFRGMELTDQMVMAKLRLRPKEKVEMVVSDDIAVYINSVKRVPVRDDDPDER